MGYSITVAGVDGIAQLACAGMGRKVDLDDLMDATDVANLIGVTNANVVGVYRRFWRSPIFYAVAVVVALLFALPLYLLKIELVPADAQGRRAVLHQAGVLFLLPAGEPSTGNLVSAMRGVGIRAERLDHRALVAGFPDRQGDRVATVHRSQIRLGQQDEVGRRVIIQATHGVVEGAGVDAHGRTSRASRRQPVR